MRLLLSGLTLLLLLFLTAPPALARAPGPAFAPGAHLRFEHHTIDDGLSQNAGLALLQDRQGYLWIGTQDGLNRYDGYGFTTFKHDPADPASLSYNGIIAMAEDEDEAGALWIGTWGGGLNRFDPHSAAFTRYQPDPASPASLASPVVTAILPAGPGQLWVGTLGGLELFDPASGTFRHFRSDPADPRSLSSDAISALLPAPGGKLWVGTGAFSTPGAGLNLLDPASGEVQRLAQAGDCLAGPNIADLIDDGQGGLWIAYGGYGVAGGGVDRYNPASGACAHYESAGAFAGQITDNNIADLLIDRDGALWVASWSAGIWRMPPERPGEFSAITHSAADSDSLASDSAFSLLQDHSGVLWIGTLNAGVDTLNLANLQFRTYKHDPASPTSIASNHVGCFAEAGGGAIWVGTWESGLAHFDPATGVFRHYRNDPADPQSLSSDLVMSLHSDRDGTLWAGTLGGGLNRRDPGGDMFVRYQHDPADPASLLEDQVTTIRRDTAGRLWVGNFAGLSRLDPGATGFVNYPMPAPPVTLSQIGDILWIGTWGGGVARLDLGDPASLAPGEAQFAWLRHDPAEPNSLSENSVWAIHPGADGVVWMGSQGGLNRYDPQRGAFTVYGERDGLRNATILGILEDGQGSLWLTTNNGLARFDPRSERFRIYDKSDGLQGNEFNSNAYLRSSSGELYVGGVSGFSVFDPLGLGHNAQAPPVVISSFAIFNQPQPFDGRGEQPISLNYDQNFISFEFAALDYQAPQKNQYAYMLEGFDRDWIAAGTRNYASYTNLPGGSYTFRVRAANNDGVWNEQGAALPLSVRPPFWQWWPFQLGLLVGLAGLVVGGFQWRLRAVRAQNARQIAEEKRAAARLAAQEAEHRRMLEQRIAERTDELNQANERLREQAAQDAVVAERTRLARDLHDAVTQTLFSTTLIADVLPEIWASSPDEGRRRLEEIRQLTRGALAEMRTLLVELRPNALVEVPLPTLLRQLSEALTGRARISIQCSSEGERKLPADVQVALYRIAQEALNNVVKHARASQALITLSLGETVRLSVADNGAGFDPFTVTADHLGLKIMRERAEAIGARLSVYSEPGEGTQISAVWP